MEEPLRRGGRGIAHRKSAWANLRCTKSISSGLAGAAGFPQGLPNPLTLLWGQDAQKVQGLAWRWPETGLGRMLNDP